MSSTALFWTAKDVSRETGLPLSTVRELFRSEKIANFKLEGGRVRYTTPEIVAEYRKRLVDRAMIGRRK